MIFPFLDFESSFFTNEELLFLAGASGGGVEHTIINNPATFTTDLAKPLRKLLVPFTPVQAGSGDPSPDNVRPITGFAGLNIYRTGKNLYDGQFPSLSSNIYYRHYFVGDATVTGSSNVPLSAQGYGNIFLLPGKVNSGVSTGGNNITDGVSRTVNPVDGWVTVAYRNNYDVNPADYNVQIEVGATATAYEPYSGATVPVSWQTEAGTVYGGELDALTGVLTVNYAYAALTATGKNANETYFYTTCQPLNIPVIKGLNAGLVCNRLKNSPNVSESETDPTISCYANGIIRWHDTEYMDLTVQEYNAAVAENPVVIAYEIKEPYTVQLDPVSLSTLVGENVVWTDTNGDNTIIYLKKT